jgi:hypothetical protein
MCRKLKISSTKREITLTTKSSKNSNKPDNLGSQSQKYIASSGRKKDELKMYKPPILDVKEIQLREQQDDIFSS